MYQSAQMAAPKFRSYLFGVFIEITAQQLCFQYSGAKINKYVFSWSYEWGKKFSDPINIS